MQLLEIQGELSDLIRAADVAFEWLRDAFERSQNTGALSSKSEELRQLVRHDVALTNALDDYVAIVDRINRLMMFSIAHGIRLPEKWVPVVSGASGCCDSITNELTESVNQIAFDVVKSGHNSLSKWLNYLSTLELQSIDGLTPSTRELLVVMLRLSCDYRNPRSREDILFESCLGNGNTNAFNQGIALRLFGSSRGVGVWLTALGEAEANLIAALDH